MLLNLIYEGASRNAVAAAVANNLPSNRARSDRDDRVYVSAIPSGQNSNINNRHALIPQFTLKQTKQYERYQLTIDSRTLSIEKKSEVEWRFSEEKFEADSGVTSQTPICDLHLGLVKGMRSVKATGIVIDPMRSATDGPLITALESYIESGGKVRAFH